MTAGFNIRVNFYSVDTVSDDIVGGALVTGTLLKSNIPARLEADRIEQVFLNQGLETERTFVLTCLYQPELKEPDQFQVTQPYNHPYLGERFRVIGVQHSNFTDRRRRYSMFNCSRSVQAHRELDQ